MAKVTADLLPPEAISDTHPRVGTLNALPDPQDGLVHVPSCARPRTAAVAVVDRLYAAMSSLPTAEGPEALVRAAVDAVGQLLPACAVGACYTAVAGGPTSILRAERRSLGPSTSTSRLFAELAHERTLQVPWGPDAVTLHVAADACLDDDGEAMQIMQRVALALPSALRHARVRDEVGVLRDEVLQLEKLATFGQIAAGFVHELNNPLTAIVAYSDLLVRRLGATEDGERVRRIAESATRLLGMSRDLVAYARPSAEARVRVDLHAAIDQAVTFCEHEFDRARTVVEKRFGAPMRVFGQPQQLVQVFVNLFTNACHAMPEAGGRVTIATELDGMRARVVIVDTGHGIPDAVLPHVFRPFFTTKGDGRGSGLGLSIVRSIVEAHQGEVKVQGGYPSGTGARFDLTLPLAAGP